LNVIRTSSREVLDEMRRLLQLLRMVEPQAGEVEDGQAGDGVTPQPGLEQLPDLVGSIRAAGLPVSLDAPESFEPVPSSVALSTYRIVQEALTNVLKHSGHVPTTVRVRRTPSALLVDVDNDAGASTQSSASPGSGHGLVGMRERVTLVGGELRTGHRPDGGFAVRAVLPVDTRTTP
jgi:signal transduction histidine kinase